MKDIDSGPGKNVLELFHPLIRKWFLDSFSEATDIQNKAWPLIASCDHVLFTAPTGSGKTLAAFLWAINQLLTSQWDTDGIRLLYVSPLKALNNDIRRNLETPLAELKELFRAEGEFFPDIPIHVRSGDTPQKERRSFVHHPPVILITTPESLNLILSSPRSRYVLNGIRSVILDEIHAVAGGKRGSHLITAVDRLVPLCGEFQRIGISATVRPIERIAEFIGGAQIKDSPNGPVFTKRPVKTISGEGEKKLDLRICFPGLDDEGEDSYWPEAIKKLKEIIRSNRSTLVFTNNRRHAEKITLLVNENEAEPIAYAHHGSLSKEIRAVVEERLKAGELKAIIATSSLELGIDIGSLDEVILFQTPPSVGSCLQRIGRSGHGVGEIARGRCFPFHGKDFLEAAVMAKAVMAKDIEELDPVEAPLDVLAQIIISMTGTETWSKEELYNFIRTSYPYRNLSKRAFDLSIDMLRGKYADTRIRELKARILVDELSGKISAREGSLSLLYLSGGTIPDRGNYNLRHSGSGEKIGELDEEFVWERKVGETFSLGSQAWKIVHIGHQDLEVVPNKGSINIFPFWRAENISRDFDYSEQIGDFLEKWNDRLTDSGFLDELHSKHLMEYEAAERLQSFLIRQKKHCDSDLPHRHHLLIEEAVSQHKMNDLKQIIIHTLWGGKINYPLSLIVSSYWDEAFGYPLETYADNDAVILMLPHDFDRKLLSDLLQTEALSVRVYELLRKKLETSAFFGGRFRENAARALLLPRQGFKNRTPLWLNRLRSKKLLSAVMQYDDFPILAETWRTCLQDEFDIPNLIMLLEELQRGEIRISKTETRSPSPFASNIIWYRTNLYMYADDRPYPSSSSMLAEDVIKETVFSSQLRPRLDKRIVAEYLRKLQRLEKGYAPDNKEELLEWTASRLFVPEDEWKQLISAVAEERQMDKRELYEELKEDLLFIRLSDFGPRGVLRITEAPRLLSALGRKPKELELDFNGEKSRELFFAHMDHFTKASRANKPDAEGNSLGQIIAEWLRYYGPVSEAIVSSIFGVSKDRLLSITAGLIEENRIIRDHFFEDDREIALCDAENLEYILRLQRRRKRGAFEALNLRELSLFLASFMGLTSAGNSVEDLQWRIEQLFGFPERAGLWEDAIFPARMETYHPSWLDSLIDQTRLIWFGCGKERISFALEQDLELFRKGGKRAKNTEIEELFEDRDVQYSFWDLHNKSDMAGGELAKALWEEVWKGKISSDRFDLIRRGIEVRFKTDKNVGPSYQAPSRRSRGLYGKRADFHRWKQNRPISGKWFLLPGGDEAKDPLEEEEIRRDRIRQLLSRYGIVFKQLLDRELSPMRWPDLKRSLRLMELSGEIQGGYFFKGIPGLQFISADGLRLLNRGLDSEAVYWMNACDPASLCGIGIEGFSKSFPTRIPSNFIIFKGSNPVIIVRKSGKELDIKVEAQDRNLLDYFKLFSQIFSKSLMVRVERINGLPVRESPYADILAEFGFRKDYKAYILEKIS